MLIKFYFKYMAVLVYGFRIYKVILWLTDPHSSCDLLLDIDLVNTAKHFPVFVKEVCQEFYKVPV